MNMLNSFDHLDCNLEDGFQAEGSIALVKCFFQTGSQQLHDQRIVFTDNAKIVNFRKARYIISYGLQNRNLCYHLAQSTMVI